MSMKRRATYSGGVRKRRKRGYGRGAVVAYRQPARVQRARFRANPRTGGFLGVERKFVDADLSGIAFTSNTWSGANLDPATNNQLNPVAQGDGESERDGRNYNMLSIHIKGYVHVDASEASVATFPDTLFRIALVLDTQTNGAQLDPTNVFTGTNAIVAFRNLQYIKRFKVLKDIMLCKDATQTNEGGTNSFAHGIWRIPFEIHHEFKTPVQVNTTGTAATVSVVTDNSLHLIGTALQDGVITANTKIYYNSRLRFVG